MSATTSLMIKDYPVERVLWLGVGAVLISTTEIEGMPAVVITRRKGAPDLQDAILGKAPDPADMDEEHFRENSTVIAFASAQGAINFIERMNEAIMNHGKKIGFVDEDGNIKDDTE